MFKRYFSDPLIGTRDIVLVDKSDTMTADIFRGVTVTSHDSKKDGKTDVLYDLNVISGVLVLPVTNEDFIRTTDIFPSRFRSFIDEETVRISRLEQGKSYVMKESNYEPLLDGDTMVTKMMRLSKVTVIKVSETKTGKPQVMVRRVSDGSLVSLSGNSQDDDMYSTTISKANKIKTKVYRSFTYI